MNYFWHLGIMLEIYMLLALAFNYVLGYAGLLSLCQALFYGVGAYTAALLGVNWHLPFVVVLPVAMVLAGGLGWLVSLLARRLRDLYFGLATLAVQVIFFSVAYNWEWATKGAYGITGIPNPNVLGWQVNEVPEFFVLGGLMLAMVWFFSDWFQETPVCRLMRCVRDDAVAVTSLGKDPERYKALAVVLGAMLSAMAGVLYATYVTYIDPTSFTLDESILILSILMIGGSGNLTGPIVGAVFYVLMPEVLKALHFSDNVAANLRLIIFGLLLILVVRLKPNGFFGTFQIR
jgi:branched-chain amino acid transport system permease protein